jgi:hypothetical protein
MTIKIKKTKLQIKKDIDMMLQYLVECGILTSETKNIFSDAYELIQNADINVTAGILTLRTADGLARNNSHAQILKMIDEDRKDEDRKKVGLKK